MSKFLMKNRPKKPSAPTCVYYPIGNCVELNYLLESIKQFKQENPDRECSTMYLDAEYDDYEGIQIYLVLPPESLVDYENRLAAYRVELKAYEEWRKKNKKNIEKYKAEVKKKTAKRKLERTKERLAKEMAEVEAKLEKV